MEKKIELDKNIYSLDDIGQAIEDYKDVVNIGLEESGDTAIVSFSDIPEEYEDVICDEFANYVLSLSIK